MPTFSLPPHPENQKLQLGCAPSTGDGASRSRGWAAAARDSYLTTRAATLNNGAAIPRKEMDFELAYSEAGGLLLVGPDSTGIGGVLTGFGATRGTARHRRSRRAYLRDDR